MDSQKNDNFLVEVYEVSSGGRTKVVAGTKVVEQTAEQIESAVNKTTQIAEGAAQKISKMDYKPDEFQIKFGIKLTAEAGVVFAKAATEGNFEIVLTWKRESFDA